MRKLVLTVALGALSSIALVACGGGGSSSSTQAATSTTSTSTSTSTQAAGGGGGGGTINLAADPSGQLKYQQSSLSAAAGNDTIDFANQAPLGHDVCVKDSSGKELGCSDVIQGSSTTLKVNVQPGTYTYYCSVDGHEAAGMEGTLTVK
jgi:plastocyanin